MTTTPSAPGDTVLSVDHLSVEYQSDTRVIRGADDVTFSIGRGEAFGLAGESGCGKSTIANAIMRLLKPPAKVVDGAIRFGDIDLLALTGEPLREFRWTRIAMVFQSAMNALNPVMTIGDQIVDAFTEHGRADRKAARDKAADLLKLVGNSHRSARLLPPPTLRRDAAASRDRDRPRTRPGTADPG